MNVDMVKNASISEREIADSVKHLTKYFGMVCYNYRQRKDNAVSFIRRDKNLNPLEENEKLDNTLYYAQIEFAYFIDEIQRGPKCLATFNIKGCSEFIEELNSK